MLAIYVTFYRQDRSVVVAPTSTSSTASKIGAPRAQRFTLPAVSERIVSWHGQPRPRHTSRRLPLLNRSTPYQGNQYFQLLFGRAAVHTTQHTEYRESRPSIGRDHKQSVRYIPGNRVVMVGACVLQSTICTTGSSHCFSQDRRSSKVIKQGHQAGTS